MPRKPVRIWTSAGPRRGNGAGPGLTDSRSLSPRSRGRLTPPLPEPPSRASPYKPALVFALTYCVGHSVSIQTRSGDVFEGILHTPGLVQSEVHFVLRKARKMKQEGWEKDFIERLVIPSAEVVQLHAKDLPIHPDPPPRPASSPVLAFPIHSEFEPVFQFGDFDDVRDIGFLGDKDRERAGAGLFGRELKKWEPEEGEAAALEFDDMHHEVGTWDQFAENEKKFGVTTNFDMDLYTTPLPEKSRYTVAQAEKLARQIQSASTPNLHLQDERNQLALDDSGLSDELLYSSVLTAQADQRSELNGASPKKSEISDRSGGDEKGETPKAGEEKKTPPITLILPHNHTRPMIISKRQGQKIDTRAEFNKVARGIASVKAIPHGSPLERSPLVNDWDSLKALDLSSVRQPLKPEVRDIFREFKEAERQKRGTTRDESWSKMRQANNKEESPLAKTPMKSEDGSPQDQAFTPQPSASALTHEQGFGSMVLKDDDAATSEAMSEDTTPDVKTQRGLPRLKTDRETGEDEEQGEENSGRRLNPNAIPFNPGQVRQNVGDSTAPLTEESASEPSTRAPTPRPVSASPTPPVPAFVPEDFPPLQPPVVPETVMPPVPHPPQPTMLIRPQPPPPPRVVTPPPPPQQPVVQEIHPPPIVMPMVRQPHRPTRQSQSPGGRRTPHNHMHPEPPPMIISNPPMMPAPQAGPLSQGSGPNHPPNAQPPNMPPHGMPHVSGGIHMMPPQMAPYPYMPEMAGRMPIMYPYPTMAAPPGPPAPPGQQNPPNSDQPPMHPPHVVYPFYPLASYPVHSYGPPMMQPAMHPGYVSMAHPPMTTQQRPGSGARGRGQRRTKPDSFFNDRPRRG